LQQEWEYHRDTENIEHGFIEALNTKSVVHHGLKGIKLTFRQSLPTWIVALHFFGDWWKPITARGAHLLLHLSSRKATLI
jgi:hypothetical protein